MGPRLAYSVAALVALELVGAAGKPASLPPEGELIRGIYAHPGPAIDNRIWVGYGQGYEFDRQEKHGGEVSVRCAAASATQAQGASQRVVFDQKEARPLIVAGWAKLEGVSGPVDYHCSVYVDLRLKNGESWPMKIAAFDPEKQGWQYAENVYEPPAPIAGASVYVFIRERAGTAWFDDIYVGEMFADGTRSGNLLESPGFEQGADGDAGYRDEFFEPLVELGCNAFHLYRSVPWDKVMATDDLPLIEEDDPFLDFVNDAHKRGFKVWLTVGVGLPPIKDATSPDFPIWACVNNRWGEAYTRVVAYMTQYGIDGVGVVPDEWNYDTGRVRRALEKHADPEVAEFYKSLPHWCDCDVCHERFQKAYGVEYPDVRQAWKTGDAVWAQFAKFRYDSTRDWIDRTVRAAKAVNPKVVTDTMICVLPVCSDNRLATGAAWDQVGATTGLDCLQTDPYILLHNYLGDSTHYYPTETTLHLGAANYARRSGVTLEACRLRDTYRDKEPVEVYGAALSCWVHGASEFFWWHMNYIVGRSEFIEPDAPKTAVRSAYDVMQAMEQYLAEGQVAGDVLVCYSRRSEDTWDWLARAGAADRVGAEGLAKRGFIAHRNVLYALLRRGIPFRMTYLEHPDPKRLAEAKVLIVPFAFALSEAESKLLREQADNGKAVIVLADDSSVDEQGQRVTKPRLGQLGGPFLNVASEGAWPADGLLGKVILVGGDYAVELFDPFPPKGKPDEKVVLPQLHVDRFARLEGAIDSALGRQASLFAEPIDGDVEVTLLESPQAYVLLAVNWETEKPVTCSLRLPVPKRRWRTDGRRILPRGQVERADGTLRGNELELDLQPQEAYLLALRKVT